MEVVFMCRKHIAYCLGILFSCKKNKKLKWGKTFLIHEASGADKGAVDWALITLIEKPDLGAFTDFTWSQDLIFLFNAIMPRNCSGNSHLTRGETEFCLEKNQRSNSPIVPTALWAATISLSGCWWRQQEKPLKGLWKSGPTGQGRWGLSGRNSQAACVSIALNETSGNFQRRQHFGGPGQGRGMGSLLLLEWGWYCFFWAQGPSSWTGFLEL